MPPKWLEWAKRLQALAQNGLTFSKDPFEVERYEQVRRIAAEIAAEHTEADPQRIVELFTSEKGYATPKVDVRGVVFRDREILLVHEKADGLWTLPGGWVDVWEAPSEAVAKEVREESGYVVRPARLLALYDRNKHPHPPADTHIYKLFFLCELVGGEPSTSLETTGVGFFAEDALPDLSVTRVTQGQIARMFEHYRSPDLPTDFD